MAEAEMTQQHDVYSLPNGQIIVQWPSQIPREELPDVLAWVDLLRRRIARCVRVESITASSGHTVLIADDPRGLGDDDGEDVSPMRSGYTASDERP